MTTTAAPCADCRMGAHAMCTGGPCGCGNRPAAAPDVHPLTVTGVIGSAGVHVIDAGFVAPGVLRVTCQTSEDGAFARLAAAALLQAGYDVARQGDVVTVTTNEETPDA
jgi:hypothetical protein